MIAEFVHVMGYNEGVGIVITYSVISYMATYIRRHLQACKVGV